MLEAREADVTKTAPAEMADDDAFQRDLLAHVLERDEHGSGMPQRIVAEAARQVVSQKAGQCGFASAQIAENDELVPAFLAKPLAEMSERRRPLVNDVGDQIRADEPVLAVPLFVDKLFVFGDQAVNVVVERHEFAQKFG